MGYPDDYPDYFKESIFMATLDGGPYRVKEAEDL